MNVQTKRMYVENHASKSKFKMFTQQFKLSRNIKVADKNMEKDIKGKLGLNF